MIRRYYLQLILPEKTRGFNVNTKFRVPLSRFTGQVSTGGYSKTVNISRHNLLCIDWDNGCWWWHWGWGVSHKFFTDFYYPPIPVSWSILWYYINKGREERRRKDIHLTSSIWNFSLSFYNVSRRRTEEGAKFEELSV